MTRQWINTRFVPPPAYEIFKVRSKSQPEVMWEVRKCRPTTGEVWYCECPAYKRTCRHIRIVQNKLKGHIEK